MNLFDFAESQSAKKHGLTTATDRHESDLALARSIAIELATLNGTTTADEVGEVLMARYQIASLGAAAGGIFRGGRFEFTGERVLSKRKSNHAREIKVWRIKSK